VLLTAVAAAVQPRAGERTRLSARGWALAALALGAASVVAEPVATTLDLLGSWSSAGSAEWAYVTAELLVPGAALAVVVANVALRRDGWAHCATVLGLTTLALVWLDGLQLGGPAARAVSTPDALTVGFLVLGLAALLASRPVADPGPVPPARSAVACGRAGLTVLLVEAAAQALGLLLLAVVDVPTAATVAEVAARLLLVGALVAALVLLRRPDPSPARRQVAAGLALLPCLAGAALLLLAMLNRPDADGGVTGFTFAPLLLTLSLGAGVYTVLALLTRGDLPASRVG
jgi:hypothetical protein